MLRYHTENIKWYLFVFLSSLIDYYLLLSKPESLVVEQLLSSGWKWTQKLKITISKVYFHNQQSSVDIIDATPLLKSFTHDDLNLHFKLNPLRSEDCNLSAFVDFHVFLYFLHIKFSCMFAFPHPTISIFHYNFNLLTVLIEGTITHRWTSTRASECKSTVQWLLSSINFESTLDRFDDIPNWWSPRPTWPTDER